MRRLVLAAVPAAALAFLGPRPGAALTTTHFESPHVHPTALSPDGSTLFVVHTAGHELVLFDLTGPSGPVRTGAVPVGYEPVTVRARTADEVWVVSHVSDAVNIVDVATRNVVRTLLPGDEPTDVVFAQGRAFVAVSQEDRIAVYDLANLDLPPASIPLDQSDPRSLALSPVGSTLYVAALDSQNETTAIHFQTVQGAGGPPPPDPPMDPGLPAPPDVALIVQHDGTAWRDDAGGSWNAVVPYTLLDHDVVAIDTVTLTVTGAHRGVGTTLFNLAVHPVSGMLYVTNQEADNVVRFEPNLQGQFLRNRVTTIDAGSGAVTPRHLNPHIDYLDPAGNAAERELSLAIPTDVTVSSAGTEIYVAATGSGKVGVLDAGGQVTRRIDVGEGPTGLALDEVRQKLYVVNRFASTLSVVDLGDDSSVEIPLGFDPSSPAIRQGRAFLYDATLSSAHGDLACASCHVFGGMDNLAWDLGDPLGEMKPSPGFGLQAPHPMKGPMTTQSLKGLTDTEPLHWRGDNATFEDFNPAFVSLMGRAAPLSATDMQAFRDFTLSMRYPPGPLRNLDGTHLPVLGGADPGHGESLYLGGGLVGNANCVDCHALPTGENGLIIPAALLAEDQDMVVPQLRNMYEKTRFDDTAPSNVRGFGYTHDGAVDDLFTFLEFPAFTFASDADREDVAAFLLAFDTGTPAAVGAQWTMDGANLAAGAARVDTLVAQADAGLVGLIAKGRDGAAEARGWVYQGGGAWKSDRDADPATNLAALHALAGSGTEITYTAVLFGEQFRLGVDRDDDGFLDQDERDVGSDPDDPGSTPPDVVDAPLLAAGDGARLWLSGANPTRTESRFGFRIDRPGAARLDVFDVSGRRVRTLVQDARHDAGRFEQGWNLRDGDGRRVSAGVYFVRLSSGEATARKRIVVLR